jgi:hypothetical protein
VDVSANLIVTPEDQTTVALSISYVGAI